MRVPALLLLVLCWSHAEEAALPPNIQSIITKAERAVAKNRTAYDAANEKAFTDAEKALKAELDKLTKSGKLDDAVQVKKLMESFRRSVVIKVDAAAMDDKPLLAAESNDPLLGKWGNGIDVMWEFKSDGTGNHYWSGAIFPYKWTHTDTGYSVVITGRAPRVLTFIDKNTINIEPGNSVRMK